MHTLAHIFYYHSSITTYMRLTDTRVHNARAKESAYSLRDVRGLHLFVKTNNIRRWKCRYRQAGRYHTITIGGYPDVSLAEARNRRDAVLLMVLNGLDPMVEFKDIKEQDRLKRLEKLRRKRARLARKKKKEKEALVAKALAARGPWD